MKPKEQPQFLTLVKVIRHGFMSRTLIARDEKGRLWQRLDGFGDTEWEPYSP